MFKLLYSSLPASTAAGNLADKGSDVTTVPPAANRGEDMDEELPVDEPEQQSEANPDGCTQAPRSDQGAPLEPAGAASPHAQMHHNVRRSESGPPGMTISKRHASKSPERKGKLRASAPSFYQAHWGG